MNAVRLPVLPRAYESDALYRAAVERIVGLANQLELLVILTADSREASEAFWRDFAGDFRLDAGDPGKSSFKLNIKSQSVDTNNTGRDNHLRSPDFFNVKQFPTISFGSTNVKSVEGGYEVTGDLTMHGETKPVTFTLKGGKTAEFPKGVQRTGYSTDLVLKRSDFGVGRPMAALGDEVFISISFEATKKK